MMLPIYQKSMRTAVTAVCLMFFCISAVYSADHYIRAGAAGANNGSDWTNAWTNLPASLTRGDTYYIADGEYPPYEFDDAESGSSYIRILKATVAAHGTNTGWNNSYGDGQAIFNDSGNSAYTILNFKKGYYILDGVVGDPADTTSYGFKVTDTTVGLGDRCYYIGIPGLGYGNFQVDHITVSHVFMNGWGKTDYAQDNPWTANCIYSNTYETVDNPNNIAISYCWMGGCSANILVRRWQDSSIHHNWFDNNWSSPYNHGEQISPGTDMDNMQLYANVFKDSNPYIVGGHKDGLDAWDIWDNIVIGGSVTACWGSADSKWLDVCTNWNVHNNTYVGVDIGGGGALFVGNLSDPVNDKSYAYNNLFINCNTPAFTNPGFTSGAVVYDNNAYYGCTGTFSPQANAVVGAGNPLNADYSPKDGELIIDAGRALAGKFSKDYYGTSRPKGDGWDIGAVEGFGATLTLDKTSLNYGNIIVGTPVPTTYTITNTGGETLSVTSIASGNPAVVAVNPSSATLAPGGSTTVGVTFTPAAVQSYSIPITMNSNAGTKIVMVTGNGIVPAPQIEVNPTSLNMGDIRTDETTTKILTISNTGSAPLTVSNITSSKSVFSVDKTSETVAAGGTMTVTVTFAPTSAILFLGKLTILSNADTKEIVISGQGLSAPSPNISVSPTTLNYGEIVAGTTLNKNYTISNTGSLNLTISSISSTNEAFTVSQLSGTVVPGGTMTVTVTFAPSAVQTYSGSINISSNDGPVTVSVSGAGVSATSPEIELSRTLIDWGGYVTGSSTLQKVTVSNPGTDVLSITSIQTTNFSVFPVGPRFTDAEPPMTLDPGESMQVNIAFEPVLAQPYQGIISINSNAGAVNIEVRGVGEPPPTPAIDVTPTSIDFGAEYIGNTQTRTITISNPGTLDLDVTSISSDSAPVFTVSPSSEVISPGGSIDATITFAPGASQVYNGTITVASDAGNKTVSLNGEGLVPEPELTINTTIFNFPDTPVNTNSVPLAFSIENTGAGELQVTGITPSNSAAFTVSETTGTVVANGTMTVSITFTPGLEQDYIETITVASNAGSKILYLYGSGILPQPVISVNQSLIDFGSKYLDTETDRSFIVTNTGLSDLTVSSITSSNPGVFSVSPSSSVVTPGADLTVVVTFSPDTEGIHSGAITIVSDAGSDKNINLKGVGTQSNVPEIALSTHTMSFGGKPVDTINSSTFDVLNTGTDVLIVNDIASSDAAFTVSPSSGTVNPGDSMPVTVTFSPPSEGEHLAAISVVSNAGNEHLSISGVGTIEQEPLLELSRVKIAFGNEFVHTIKRETVVFRNTGTDILLLNNILSSNPDVFFADPTSATILPDESVDVIVTFNPQQEIEYPSDFLTYSTNAGMGVIKLSGTGTSASESIMSLSQGDNGLELDTIEMGGNIIDTSGDETFTITNIGTSMLNISSISVSNPEVLSVIPSYKNLDPGEKLTVLVTFTPTEEKKYYESLTITTNTGDTVIPVNGEGSSNLYPIMKLSEQEIAFGNCVVNTLNFYTFEVKNTGTADLIIHYVNTNAEDILSATPFEGTINPGKSLYVDVTFTPNDFISINKKVFINSNAGLREIPLTGTGIKAIVPQLAFTPDALTFGDVYTDDPVTKSLTMKNDGGLLLTISDIASSNPAYTVKPDKGTIEPGMSLPLEVTFAPANEGLFSETLTFTSNAGTKQVAVDGTGLSATKPILRPEKDTLEFDSVLLGAKREQLVKLFNDGTANLVVESITVSNESIVTATFSDGVVIPRENLEVKVGFSPDTEIDYLEQIYITSNAGPDTITVTGSGSTSYYPHISSVTITPDQGWVRVGDSVTITVVEEERTSGLIPSSALINKESIPLEDKGDGTYVGVYTVGLDDERGRHIEAENIRLSTSDGNTSDPASSVGSKLNVDNKAPKIDSVVLTDGTAQFEDAVSVGDKVTVIVTAGSNETGLIPSDATINSIRIPLTDAGDGTYVGEYIIQENDPEGENVEATGITLKDLAGNVSEVASSSGSNLSILGTTPVDPAETDFNSDGIVNLFDFSQLLLSYGSASGDPDWNPVCDLNNDGVIDLNDFLIFNRNYGDTVAKVAKAANSIAAIPESDIGIQYSSRVDFEKSIEYVSLQFDDTGDLDGFDLDLQFDSDMLTPVTRSIGGLVGLSIPIVRGNLLKIASIFGDDAFDGTITIGFRYNDQSQFGTVALKKGMVIDGGRVKNISSISEISSEESVGTVIADLTASNPSEQHVSLTWTPPSMIDSVASYRVDILSGHSADGGGTLEKSQLLDDIRQSDGSVETTRISGLKPGCSYQFVINTLDESGRITGRSNLSSIMTLAGFVDDDLDPKNPFIIRDADSLFVADNDNLLTFVWSSWKDAGAEEYEVSVRNETTIDIVTTYTVAAQKTTFTGESGMAYSVKIVPLSADGERLAVLLSRTILCAAGTVEKPGVPRLIPTPE